MAGRSGFRYGFVVVFLALLTFMPAALAVSIDVPPYVAVTADTGGAGSTTVLTVIAIDFMDNAGVSSLDVYEDGLLLKSKDCQGSKTCTSVIYLKKPAVGTFSYSAKARDIGGQVVSSETVTKSYTLAPPVLAAAIPDVSFAEDGSTTLNLASYFSDSDNTILRYSYQSDTSNAAVAFSGTTAVLSSASNWFGTATITVFAFDGDNTVNDSIVVTVTPVNDAPTLAAAIPDVSLDEGSSIVLNMANYFADVDSALSYSYTSPNPNVTVAFTGSNANVSLAQFWSGSASVTITASDGQYNVSDTFTATAGAVNDAPIATGTLAFQVAEDSGLANFDLSSRFTDPEGDTITFSLIAETTSKVDCSVSGSTLSATPAANWNGVGVNAATCTVRASDGSLFSDNAVSVNVTAVNDAPVLSVTIPNQTWAEDTNRTINLSAYFSDVDGDTLAYSLVVTPVAISTSFSSGVATLTPNANWNGQDFIQFRASDGSATADSNLVTLTVTNVNDAPVIQAPTAASVSEGSTLTIDVNGTDADGDTLAFSTNATSGSINATTGVFTWTPTFSQSGSYSVQFTVSDGNDGSNAATTTITVGNTNQNPSISTTPVATGAENSSYSYDVDATDADGDTLTFSLTTFPTGMIINAVSGLISWTPGFTQAGNHDVTVNVTDSNGGSATQSWTIAVSNTDRAPAFSGPIATQTWVENTVRTIDLSQYFSDVDGDALTYSVAALPTNVSVNIAGSTATLTPDTSWFGTTTVQFRANDSQLTADSNAVTLNVTDATVQGHVVDSATGAALAGKNISFYLDTQVASKYGDPEVLANYTYDTWQTLTPKATPDAVTDANGYFYASLPDGTYNYVIQGSREDELELVVNSSAGTASRESEVKSGSTNFNAEGHILYMGKLEGDGNKYTCGQKVRFVMFGVNNGGTSETVTFVVQNHTSIGGPTAPIIYNGNVNNPVESLTVPAGDKASKVFDWQIPCPQVPGRYDIHVVWYGDVWHKIGNFFVIADTTAPQLNVAAGPHQGFRDTNITVGYFAGDTVQAGTVPDKVAVMSVISGVPNVNILLKVDKDIATDGPDADVIVDNDADVNAFGGNQEVNLTYSASGVYTARFTATDLSGNSVFVDRTVTAWITEVDADTIATPYYTTLCQLNESGELRYDYQILLTKPTPDANVNLDMFTPSALFGFDVGHEYTTPMDGLTSAEYTAIKAVENDFVSPEFVKVINSTTASDFNTTLRNYFISLENNGQINCPGLP